MSNEVLIRVDRNGTKYYADDTCQRCGGAGERDEWYYTGKFCYECGGTGHSKTRMYKVYTPEYQAKLDARRAAKRAKYLEEHAEEIARREAEEKAAAEKAEAERKAREEREAAERAISNYVGNVGERTQFDVTYVGSPYFKRRDLYGGEETVYIHTFKDDAGNKLVWKTQKGINLEEGNRATVVGTVKEHSEYKGEKQTLLLRCKISA